MPALAKQAKRRETIQGWSREAAHITFPDLMFLYIYIYKTFKFRIKLRAQPVD